LDLLESYANKGDMIRSGQQVIQLGKEFGQQIQQEAGRATRRPRLPESLQRRLEDQMFAAAGLDGAPPRDDTLEDRKVHKIQFVFQLFDGDRPVEHQVTPLSWTLSRKQKNEIDQAWKEILNRANDTNNPPQLLDKLFDKNQNAVAKTSGQR
jgi:hypothetical protein